MNKASYIVAGVLVVLSFAWGAFYGKSRCEKCPTPKELSDSAAYFARKSDSLSREIDRILSEITPVTNEPETIKVVVGRRLRLQRAAGVDSSAAVLFADPK